MHDVVIRDARIVDGTGSPERHGDLAIDGGVVSAVGAASGAGRREIDAGGAIVAPGWVDIHTHYDGQALWDPEMSPSSWHGVTTVVMGNCGVGFAPVRPGGEDFLIELMEGVEDIPGAALHEGIDWQWESFGEYLDALDRTPRVVDVGAQVPHTALRAYVMGERAHDDATDDEIQEIAALARAGLEAGALGFSSSRTVLHRSRHGLVPGTDAALDELRAIALAIRAAGHGVFEIVTDHAGTSEERAWLTELADLSGDVVSYVLAQTTHDKLGYRTALEATESWGPSTTLGSRLVPQVSCRPTGLLFGFRSSLHPFITHPTYRALAKLPFTERIARLQDPAMRAQLLQEEPGTRNRAVKAIMTRWTQMFPLGDPPDYEPPASACAAAVAARLGTSPEEVVLDWMLAREGNALVFGPLTNYADNDHECIREMITHPGTALGLSDGGAHCMLVCDASMPTYLLTHWVRDRSRGPRIPLEVAVNLQTARTSALYGLHDRGTLVPGKRADLNIIDLDALTISAPEMVNDLPAHASRLVQHVDGYRYTMVAGTVTFENGEPTGARPGRLVRAK